MIEDGAAGSREALADDVALALNYAPAGHREAFEKLFTLDKRLGQIVASAKEPQLAAIRLVWWRDQLAGLRAAAEPADPLLMRCRALVLDSPVEGAMLADMAEGWAMALPPGPETEAEFTDYATYRGASLFSAIAVCARASNAENAGRAFALADLARSSTDSAIRAKASALVTALPRQRLASALRPLALLAHWARSDAARIAVGKSALTMRRKAWSALWFAILNPAV